jgi:hypothetical protein
MERFRRAGTPIPQGFAWGAGFPDFAADPAGSQKKSRRKRLFGGDRGRSPTEKSTHIQIAGQE